MRFRLNKQLVEKIRESMASVLPITAIVFLLSVTVAPLETGPVVLFLFGAILLVVGMGLFTLGVDMSMIPMGQGIGRTLSKSKGLLIPLAVFFVLGLLTTMAEPDLQVLAGQMPAIGNTTLILTVAGGVACFWWWPPCAPGWGSRCAGCCWFFTRRCLFWPSWPLWTLSPCPSTRAA